MFEGSISVYSDDLVFQKTNNALPKLSIIIPVFNNSKNEIYRCLNSINNQVYENIETLIIDDGSSLQCRDMLDELPLTFRNCYVKHKEHSGVSAARNFGVSIASGDFITFIDSDDSFADHFFLDLKQLFSVYNLEKFDVIYGYVKRVYELPKSNVDISPVQLSNIRLVSLLDKENLVKEFIENHIDTFRDHNGYLGCVSVARVVKSSIMKKNKFNEALSLNEDNIWNLDLLKKSSNSIIIDHCWYYYIYNKKSATHKFSKEVVQSYEKYLDYLWKNYIIKPSYAVRFLKLTIHLSLNLKGKSYKSNLSPKLRIRNLFKNDPWKKEFKWAYIFHLSIKEQIIFVLLKLKLIDFIYCIKIRFFKSNNW